MANPKAPDELRATAAGSIFLTGGRKVECRRCRRWVWSCCGRKPSPQLGTGRFPRMLLIVGSLIVLVSVIGGFLGSHGHLGALWQPFELIIIGGAALGAFLTSN